MHNGEIIVFTRAPTDRERLGVFYTLGLVDGIFEEEFDARFRALDPEQLKNGLRQGTWFS